MQPGQIGSVPGYWPADSHLKLARDADTAVIFLHPGCPCSMSTLTELSKIMWKCKSALQVQALIWQPDPSTQGDSGSKISSVDTERLADLAQTSRLVQYAHSIPAMQVFVDSKGSEAKIFGAETSGCVMVYSRYGKLLFSGGITEARGHEGDNIGADAVVSAVRDSRKGTVTSTPVFGCSLVER